jgi:CubicO group peptidase (beta-lactamase class C family)
LLIEGGRGLEPFATTETTMSRRSRLHCIGILTMTVIGFITAQTHTSSPRASSSGLISADVEQKIRTLVARGNLPSLQAAVVSDGGIVWSKAFGQDTSLHTVYMIGSIQKVFDATAILQLHERGIVNIDNDVNIYLPFPVRHPGYPQIAITIKMLLAHRSGLDAFKDQFYWDTQGIFEHDSTQRKRHLDTLTLERFLRASLDPEGTNYSAEAWRFEPGTQYHYSVSAYSLLKYILERVTGTTYPRYMKENTLDPLSMDHSVFTTKDPSVPYAQPFTRKDGKNLPLPLWEGNVSLMRSTAEDMAMFLLVHMNDGSYDNVRILNPETIALMHARHSHKKGLFHLTSTCPFPGYGLGIIDYGGDWYGHGGSTVGFQSLWSFNKSNRSGYVILTNVNGILYGRKNFDDVWATVSAVEEVLKSELEPPSTLKYLLLSLFFLAAIGGSIIFIRRRRERIH